MRGKKSLLNHFQNHFPRNTNSLLTQCRHYTPVSEERRYKEAKYLILTGNHFLIFRRVLHLRNKTPNGSELSKSSSSGKVNKSYV